MLTLTRTYEKNYTRGILETPNGIKLDTLELTYNNNEREVSCIPEKKYILKCHYSQNFKDCLKIYEPDFDGYWNCSKYLKKEMIEKTPKRLLREVENREHILIHAGNSVNNFCYVNSKEQSITYRCNSKGCILIGSGFFKVKDLNNEEHAFITGSKKALQLLYEYVREEEEGFTDLLIKNNNNQEGDYDE